MENDLNLRGFVSTRIRYLRQQKGMSQENLSEAAGLDFKHINKIENMKNNIRLETLEKIITALGETYESFFDCKFPTSSYQITRLLSSIEEIPYDKQTEIIEAMIVLITE